ncbi:hypothetical protein BB561_004010 [Smittium simulii]|uniref:Uncharacterized protein n=1 Tax=Smittium simulii TaxID=133385 RepID=A0A2T9YIJ1_9FUNG|nr:hypothetical protein BB561_004010 [Smittium simulii]
MDDYSNKSEINWNELDFSKGDKIDMLNPVNTNSIPQNGFNLDLKDIMAVGSDALIDINDFIGELKDVDSMLDFDFAKELDDIEIDGSKCNFEINQDYINSIFNENAPDFDLKDGLMPDLKNSHFTTVKNSTNLDTTDLNFAQTEHDLTPKNSVISLNDFNTSILANETRDNINSSEDFLNHVNIGSNTKDSFSLFEKVSLNYNISSTDDSKPLKSIPHKNLSLNASKPSSKNLKNTTDNRNLPTNSKSDVSTPSSNSDLSKTSNLNSSFDISDKILNALSSPKDSHTKNIQNKTTKSKRKASLISGKKAGSNKVSEKRSNSKAKPDSIKNELLTSKPDQTSNDTSKNDLNSFLSSLKTPSPQSNTNTEKNSRASDDCLINQLNPKKSFKKSKSNENKKNNIDFTTTSNKVSKLQSTDVKQTSIKKRRSSKLQTKITDNFLADNILPDEGYYDNPNKFLKLFGSSFAAEPKSILSEKDMYLSLTRGVVPVSMSCSCKNIIAISWSNSYTSHSLPVNDFVNSEISTNTASTLLSADQKGDVKSSFTNNKNHDNLGTPNITKLELDSDSISNQSSVVNLFKLTNVRPKIDDYVNEYSVTQRLIPLGQIFIDPNNFNLNQSQLAVTDSSGVPLSEVYNSPPQIWWCNEGDHISLADSSGRLSIFELKDSPSKWQNVLNKHLVYPISSFMWISDRRKHISAFSIIPESGKPTNISNVSDKNVSITICKKMSPIPSFGKINKFFFALNRVGRLHMMSCQDHTDNDYFIDFSPPNSITKIPGFWAVSHSDIAQISSNLIENKYHFKILDKSETDSMPHPTVYILVAVHWTFFSMFLVASGELKIDNSDYKTTILKLAPPTHFNTYNVDSPRLHRIIIVQSKLVPSKLKETDKSPMFESMLYGFDIVFEKNPIAEANRLHKLRSLRVMHYKSHSIGDNESNYSLPIGINILTEKLAINYESLLPLGIKPPKNETHCSWVIYWSNGSLTSYVKGTDKKVQPYESKFLVPTNKKQDLFNKCWTTCATLTFHSSRFLRINSSIVQDADGLSFTNCGNLELIDIEVFKNSFILFGTQLYMPSISKNKALFSKGTFELSYEYMVSTFLASRILNESDTSDIIDALVKLYYKENVEIDIKNMLSITGSMLCKTMGMQTLTLSLIDSNSWFFVVFFGIAMKVLSLTHKDSLLSSTISFVLHISSVSNAYFSARSSILTGLADNNFNPKVFGLSSTLPNKSANDKILLNYPPLFGTDVSSLTHSLKNEHPFSPLNFNEWALCYSQMLSQGTWSMNAITFLIRELYLWFHSYNQQLNNPNINSEANFSMNTLNQMWQTTPSRIVLLSHLQTVTSICDCFKLIHALKSDITIRIQVLSQIQTPNGDLWSLPQNFSFISDLSLRLNQLINSLPIPISVLEGFFTEIQSLLITNVESIGVLSIEQTLSMLLSGVMDSKLFFLVPKFAAIFFKHILSLKSNPLYQLSSPVVIPSQLPNDAINNLLNYNTIYINVLGCYDSNMISLLTSKPTIDPLVVSNKAQLSSTNLTDFDHKFLWANEIFKPPTHLNSKKPTPTKKTNTPTVIPANSFSSIGVNNYMHVDTNNYSYLNNHRELISAPKANVSPFLRPMSHSPRQMLYKFCKSHVIDICPIMDQHKLSSPFIDSITKKIINFPIPAIFSSNNKSGIDLNKNSITKSNTVMSSVLKVCFNCWQMSLLSAPSPTFKDSSTNTQQQSLPYKSNTFTESTNVNMSEVFNITNTTNTAASTVSAIPMSINTSKDFNNTMSPRGNFSQKSGVGEANLTPDPLYISELNTQQIALSEESKGDLTHGNNGKVIFNLVLNPQNSNKFQKNPSDNKTTLDNKGYYCQSVRRYDKHCICGGDWIYI